MKQRLMVALILVLLLTTMVVRAGPPDPHPGPATHEYYPDCVLPDAEWNLWYFEDCSPTISLITNGGITTYHWHAHARLPEGAALPEGGAVHFTYENSGFACWWEEGVETTNYRITITPKGNVSIHCHFRPDKWQPD